MNKLTMLEAAKAWGAGKEVQWMSVDSPDQLWRDMSTAGFCFNTHIQYRLKPEVTTSLSNNELWDIYYKDIGYQAGRGGSDMSSNASMRVVADAAIKRYIEEQGK